MNRVAIYDSYKKVEQNIYADDKAHQNDSEESNTKKVKCFACINKTGKNIEVGKEYIHLIMVLYYIIYEYKLDHWSLNTIIIFN